MHKVTFRKLAAISAALCLAFSASADPPRAIPFQALVKSTAGAPVNGAAQPITLSLYTAATGGVAVYSEPQTVAITGGLLATTIGNGNSAAFGALQFNVPYFVGVKIGSDPEMTPRFPLAAVPYADYATSVAPAAVNGVSWALAGNSGTNPASQFIGTTDNQPVVLKTNGHQAVQFAYAENAAAQYRSVNVVGGSEINTVSAGIGETIAGGGMDSFSSTDFPNSVTGDFGTIGGGFGNTSGAYSTVAGGYSNNAGAYNSTVAGGYSNGAGGNNSTVGGGNNNSASATSTTIAGGQSNKATTQFGTVVGGRGNNAQGDFAFIGGGRDNVTASVETFVGGGRANQANGGNSTIGGGYANVAGGTASMILGGLFNAANGTYSFASGYRAKAVNDGTFVWADSTDADFLSTGPNQFLIRAGGGVGINTPSPTAALEVAAGSLGTTAGNTLDLSNVWGQTGNGVQLKTRLLRTADGTGWSTASLLLQRVTDVTPQATIALNGSNVGIGTTTPGTTLEVSGSGDQRIRLSSTTGSGLDFIANNASDAWVRTIGAVPLYLAINGSSNPALAVATSGNIGIGTVTPASKLEVVGDARISVLGNGLIFPDGTKQTTAASGGGGSGWSLTGNAGTNPSTNFLGTTDNQPFSLRVNNNRAMYAQYVQAPDGQYQINSINIANGYNLNSITPGVAGATIAGGGDRYTYTVNSSFVDNVNKVTDHYGTIGGGFGNVVGNSNADFNDGRGATVAGGANNQATKKFTTVGGGTANLATGDYDTVAGGWNSQATGGAGFIGGGWNHRMSGQWAVIGGGYTNTANGVESTVPGGANNSAAGGYSFAAGYSAKANHDGAFVWADSTGLDFASTAANQFLVRAAGGVGIGLNNPGYPLDVQGDINARGNVRANGIALSSDARFKTNVQTFDNALEAVLNLRGVTFNWNQRAWPGRGFPAGPQVGFIAQEVERVLPQLVTTDSNGYKAVAYANVVPITVEAIKAQQRQIEEKDARIRVLEAKAARVDELEARLARLEQRFESGQGRTR